MRKFNFLAPAFLAQLVHLFAGAWWFTFCWFEFNGLVQIGAFGLFLGGILFKEAVVDPRIEVNQPFLWEGVKDWMMYPVGFGLAYVFIWLAPHL